MIINVESISTSDTSDIVDLTIPEYASGNASVNFSNVNGNPSLLVRC
jgi:hypothetical protein